MFMTVSIGKRRKALSGRTPLFASPVPRQNGGNRKYADDLDRVRQYADDQPALRHAVCFPSRREGRMISSSFQAFRRAIRWMMSRVESFPVPIEDVSCVQALGHPDAVRAAYGIPAPRAVKFRGF